MTKGIMHTHLHSLKKLYSGKVRDLYAIDEQRMLIVATDRLSAFDIIMNNPVPTKGQILTAISNFWFDYLQPLCPNHLTHDIPESVIAPEDLPQIEGRSVVVKRLRPIPIEAVVRGYLTGTSWKEYCTLGTVCSMPLPTGLKKAGRLPEPLFTPSTKAAIGKHDENISFKRCSEIIGTDLAHQIRKQSLQLYNAAASYALQRGLIIADTKFEFGLDEQGILTLMDEALTPDSSRFWPIDSYQEGVNPKSFDKQFMRDWLEASGWNKQPPAPTIPQTVLEQTATKYREALMWLTNKPSV